MESLETFNNQHRNPLSDTTNRAHEQGLTSIQRLQKENKELKEHIKHTTRKYWSIQRKNHCLEEVATARKVDLKQAKSDSAHLRGVVHLLGKDLTELR